MGPFGRLGDGHVYEVRKKFGQVEDDNTLHDPKRNGEALHWRVHVCNSEPDEVMRDGEDQGKDLQVVQVAHSHGVPECPGSGDVKAFRTRRVRVALELVTYIIRGPCPTPLTLLQQPPT